jgi:DNA-binding XRE family transcriptional regulator
MAKRKQIEWETNEQGCHLVTSHTIDADGYALLFRDGHRKAHRWMWSTINGAIPSGMVIMHKCDNRRCINPEHLQLGTIQDNVTDKVNKGRQSQVKDNRKSWKDGIVKNNINKIRLEKKLKQSELAKMIGVNQTHLSRVERGEKNFSLEVMQKVAKALNVSIDELLTEN